MRPQADAPVTEDDAFIAAARVTTSPWRLVDYWGWTKEPNPANFELR